MSSRLSLSPSLEGWQTVREQGERGFVEMIRGGSSRGFAMLGGWFSLIFFSSSECMCRKRYGIRDEEAFIKKYIISTRLQRNVSIILLNL